MSEITDRNYAHADVLVSTDWIAEHLHDPAVRIVESNEDTLLYAAGHIPGAVHVDWTSDLNDQVRRDYVGRDAFNALMSRIGVTQETTVVFYGDRNNWWACYAFWVFQLFGHARAKVMDGGRLKWEKEDRPLTREVPHYPADDQAPERKDAEIRAFREEVLAHVQGHGQLVDVRSPEEFSGTRLHMPEYPNEGAMRGGHIPGAKSIPWARAVNADDGTFKSGRGASRLVPGAERAPPSERDHRLLPHRRAQQPHVVRAEVPARLREHPQLRRELDGVGKPGGRAD